MICVGTVIVFSVNSGLFISLLVINCINSVWGGHVSSLDKDVHQALLSVVSHYRL